MGQHEASGTVCIAEWDRQCSVMFYWRVEHTGVAYLYMRSQQLQTSFNPSVLSNLGAAWERR